MSNGSPTFNAWRDAERRAHEADKLLVRCALDRDRGPYMAEQEAALALRLEASRLLMQLLAENAENLVRYGADRPPVWRGAGLRI